MAPDPRTGSSKAAGTMPTGNIQTIAKLEEDALLRRSVMERIGDRIVPFAGSPAFALFHVVWFTLWIAMNRGMVPGVLPFPFLGLVPWPFRLGVEAGEPEEAEDQAADRGAARGPATGEAIEPRSVHVVLRSSTTRPFPLTVTGGPRPRIRRITDFCGMSRA